MDDDIKSPSHYTQGNIEVIDFVIDQKLNYCEGNVVKYICRYKYKGTPKKDLLKARQYIDFLLRQYDEAERDSAALLGDLVPDGFTVIKSNGTYYLENKTGGR